MVRVSRLLGRVYWVKLVDSFQFGMFHVEHGGLDVQEEVGSEEGQT